MVFNCYFFYKFTGWKLLKKLEKTVMNLVICELNEYKVRIVRIGTTKVDPLHYFFHGELCPLVVIASMNLHINSLKLLLHLNWWKLTFILLFPPLYFFFTLNTPFCPSMLTFPLLGAPPPSPSTPSLCFLLLLQRAMRVRSHSMETMVGTHRHRSPGVGGGVPASVSGGGLPQSTSECTKSTFTVSKRVQWSERGWETWIVTQAGRRACYLVPLNIIRMSVIYCLSV